MSMARQFSKRAAVPSVADRLGFGPDRTEALKMASAIHDLGKISIPGEILNKPGRLSETEQTLVRTHAQAGVDILSCI